MSEEGPATVTVPVAVKVQGAYKRYPQHIVLQGLNLNLPQGCIYGLLGPSGCGKTTLLNCIVGRLQLDAGDIFVRAKNKQDIGYMPQDLSLNMLLSIHETLVYFGLLAGKSKAEILKRIEDLQDLLQLPPSHRKLEDLSGGQQRRVSLSVALLHNPELLILDEPTVGLDPLINENIWKMFLHLSALEKKTILITTHYIEETKQANLVGLMRDGVLLAEENPQVLMSLHQSNSLEDVFLLLCHQQSTKKITDEGKELEYPLPQKQLGVSFSEDGFRWSCVGAELVKHFYWAKENIGIMLFIFVIPIVMFTLFGTCLGKDPKGLDLGVVSEELPLGLSQCLTYPLQGCHLQTPLSCRYLEALKAQDIDVVEYDSYQEGLEAAKKNDVWGLLHFPSQYTYMLLQRQNNASLTDEDLDLADVDVQLDMSNLIIGHLLKKYIITSYYIFMMELYQDCGWPVKKIENPITFEKPVYGSLDTQFADYSLLAFLTLVIFIQPMTSSMVSIISDKQAGIYDRSSVAGADLSSIFVATAIWQGLLQCLHTGFMLAVYLALGYSFIGNILLTVVLLAFIGTIGFNLGFLIALLNVEMSTGTSISFAMMLLLSISNGMIWPVESMMPVLKHLCLWLPLTLPTEAVRGVMSRGWGFHHPVTQEGLAVLIGWNIFLVVAVYLVFKFRKAFGW